jgi:uncharacterized membrane protein YhaH (DUF805 family)
MEFWKHFYTSPTGRTGRRFYWLFGFLPMALLGLIAGFLEPHDRPGLYGLVLTVLLLWPQTVLLVRRFHDIALSGWWVLLLLLGPAALFLVQLPLPRGFGIIAAWLAAVCIGLIPGTRGPNKFGSDPRGRTIET